LFSVFLSLSKELDDKETFPLFGRLIPADDGTAMPLLQLLVHQFGASHVGVIFQNDAYGNKYITSIRAEAKLYPGTTVVGIDIPTWATSEDFKQAVSVLKASKFRYFFAIVNDAKYAPLMKEAYQQGIAGTGKHHWIFADGLSDSTVTNAEYDKDAPLYLASRGLSRLAAVGGFAGVSPIYDEYLQAFTRIAANKQDIEILQSMQPMHPEKITESILLSPQSSSFSILYDTVIALGLAACNASARLDGNFTGKDHYDAVLGMVSGIVLVGLFFSSNPKHNSHFVVRSSPLWGQVEILFSIQKLEQETHRPHVLVC
jgi:Receptor family ligand binding region